jgi:YggT family protein
LPPTSVVPDGCRNGGHLWCGVSGCQGEEAGGVAGEQGGGYIRLRQTRRSPRVGSATNGRRAMFELFQFISYVLQLYVYVLIAAAVLSWLVAFNVVNLRNPIVSAIGQFFYAVTEPVLRPIRRLLPNMGGIDISPIIVILIIFFIQSVILPNLYRALA